MDRFVRIGLLIILGLVSLIVFVTICMRFMTSSFIFGAAADVPLADVAIIPGASVIGKTLSPILAARADAAIVLYKSAKVGQILITGDHRSPYYDEVTPVRTYLLSSGIPATDILEDEAGYDTYSSMFRAKNVFNVSSAVIVTQDFHLPRAVFLARSLGIDAYGFEASGSGTNAEYLREIPASIKALWDLIVRRVPRSS